MAVDSIIARPTKRVRVMVAEASGCCASEVKAVATARPSPSAGPMQPKPVVRPAVAIEATAMRVMLSISVRFRRLVVSPSRRRAGLGSGFAGPWSGLASSDGGRDIDRGQDGEDISLHHA